MIELLRYANRTKIAKQLKVHPSTVGRWAKGESVPAWAVQQVERLVTGETKEAAPPEWARRLHQELVDRIDGLTMQLERRLLEALREAEAADARDVEQIDAAARRMTRTDRQSERRRRAGDKDG